MRHTTVLIIPATVPDAQVTRLRLTEAERPHVISAAPSAVPVARATPLLPERVTVEQVERLRAENNALRDELRRVRAS